jgi:CRP/FNR family cyclic AMP-dependent transcriptional regulator
MSVIENFLLNGKTIRFKKGDILISPKKEPKGVYLLSEGFIYSYSKSSVRKKKIQTILQKGEIFPLIWVISNLQKNVFVEALTDGRVYIVEKEKFLSFVNNTHEATLELITILSNTLSTYVDRLDNLEYAKVRGKVINRLLFFANRFSHTKGKKRAINLPLTHKLIAESINVSRENVTRELKSLEKKKIIAFNKRQIIIVDINQLREELHEGKNKLSSYT